MTAAHVHAEAQKPPLSAVGGRAALGELLRCARRQEWLTPIPGPSRPLLQIYGISEIEPAFIARSEVTGQCSLPSRGHRESRCATAGRTKITCCGLNEFQASPEGERSPEPGSDDWIYLCGTGCIILPFHPCPCFIPRPLQEIHGQFPVIRLQHAGDSSAGSADALSLQGTVTDELPEPQIQRRFADWAQSQGRAGR